MTWQKMRSWSWIVPSLAASWLLLDKVTSVEVPDSITPATIERVIALDNEIRDELSIKLAPLEQTARSLSYDAAVKGISWGLGELERMNRRHTDEYVHEQLCGNKITSVEGYYRMYERGTGSKHPTEANSCD